jgi:signal transduction histidine kinase
VALWRSFYWRIAAGFIAFLAAIAVAQAALFVWLVSRSFGSMPGRSGRDLTSAIAADVGAALARDPGLDLSRYVRDEYAQSHPFFIVMTDGRVVANTSAPPAEPLVRLARARLERPERRPPPPGGDNGPPPFPPPGGRDRGRFGGPPPEFRGRGRGGGPLETMPIEVNGETKGVVALAPVEPLEYAVRQYAPTLAIAAVTLVALGTTLAAVVVFGPARRRLRALESATARIGAGDLDVRAPDEGGDEIAALARSFNRMARDLAQRDEQVRAADRLRRQLLADVSHELNTPLTAIRGYVETLGMPGVTLDEPTRTRYVKIVEDETRRLERLVVDLLDLARLEGGGGALTIREVRAADLFARITARHERAAAERQITLAVEVAPDAERVQVDPDRMEQVLQNLAANAVRYTPPGGRIELTAGRESGPAIVLRVTNTGAGIPAEHLPHVFDRFYKADESRTERSGSGLGLSIAKAIVERHGGTIAAASDPGRTTFEIRLPLRSH